MTDWSWFTQRRIYAGLLGASLVLLLISSWNAPLSGDEYVHVEQAKKNIRYFRTHGADKSALDTPISRLKHYGQSFDTLTTWLADIWHIDNLYRFRHLANAIVAWLIILFTSLCAIRLTSNRMAGILAVVLLLVTLRFIGHAMNNLKDIPFAFAMIFSLYHTLRVAEKMPKIPWINLLWVLLGVAMAISIRIGGLLALAFFILFTALYFYYLWVSDQVPSGSIIAQLLSWLGIWAGVSVGAYLLGVLPWPWALENIIQNPWKSLSLMHHYPTTVRQIFEGQLFWSDDFPWYYVVKYLWITLPVVLLMGFGAFFVLPWRKRPTKEIVFSCFVLIAAGFPLFYAAVEGSNVYGGWRQLLFVLPPLVVLAAAGWCRLFDLTGKFQRLSILAMIFFVVLLISPVRYFIINYPYQYAYFNEMAGGLQGALGHYETDYYFTGFNKAYEFIDQQSLKPGTVVAANFVIPEYYKNKTYRAKLIDYYNRSSENWDFAVIGNTFLHPYQLEHGLWPPTDAIFVTEADGVPMAAVIRRTSKADYRGAQLLNTGKTEDALAALDSAVAYQPKNVSVRLLRANVYFQQQAFDALSREISVINTLYPENEQAIELRAKSLKAQGNVAESEELLKQIIDHNKRYFSAYVTLSTLYKASNQVDKAIDYLKKCLRLNPFYRPAYQRYGEILLAKGDKEMGEAMIRKSRQGKARYQWN